MYLLCFNFHKDLASGWCFHVIISRLTFYILFLMPHSDCRDTRKINKTITLHFSLFLPPLICVIHQSTRHLWQNETYFHLLLQVGIRYLPSYSLFFIWLLSYLLIFLISYLLTKLHYNLLSFPRNILRHIMWIREFGLRFLTG